MKTLRCPVCRKEVPLTSESIPFCGDRCRLIDLGMWASEEYRIPLEPAPSAGSPAGDEDE